MPSLEFYKIQADTPLPEAFDYGLTVALSVYQGSAVVHMVQKVRGAGRVPQVKPFDQTDKLPPPKTYLEALEMLEDFIVEERIKLQLRGSE